MAAAHKRDTTIQEPEPEPGTWNSELGTLYTLTFDTSTVELYVEAQGMVTVPKSDLPQGTLDLLILKVVALGPLHGYAIAQRLQQVSRDVVQVHARLALPGAAPARKPRLAGGRLEALRHRARGQVLSPDAPKGARTWRPRRKTGGGSTQAVGLILKTAA